MKKLIAGPVLLAGFMSPAYAHTLSFQEGLAALNHQLLGAHHLPFTVLLIVVGVVLVRSWRKKAN